MLTRNLMPFRTLGPTPLFAEMDRQFDRLLGELGSSLQATVNAGLAGVAGLPLNLWHDDEAIYAEAEIPGVPPEQLEVLTERDSLTIRFERASEHGGEERGEVLRNERTAGRFERTVSLPVAIDTDGVSAELRHGVLRITMPKAPEARARRVQVTAG
mgnify:CR=1 FL=1